MSFFMAMQFPEDPLTHVKTWQKNFKKIKQECGVAEMDEPGVTKDSREALHDTSHAIDHVKDWRTFWSEVLDEPEWKTAPVCYKEDTVNDFADIICCALEKMNGKEVFECFVKAAEEQYDTTKKEYDKVCELMDQIK